MSRSAPRLLVAWLLLCLLRTLLPEAWLVAWHPHQHTTAEPAFGAAWHPVGKLLFTVRHQHCHAEQFYNVPFAPAVCAALPAPATRPVYAAPSPRFAPAPRPKAVEYRASRGPPVA